MKVKHIVIDKKDFFSFFVHLFTSNGSSNEIAGIFHQLIPWALKNVQIFMFELKLAECRQW